MSVRAAEQAARWAGATDEDRAASGAVDPALAERARAALEARSPGARGTSRATRIEIEFDGDTDLEELVELLERAARF